jgi:hypothetical protein
LRIKILRMIKWRGLANILGKHFDQVVTIVRAILIIVIIFMMVLVIIG